jgi:hypothetical protein
VWQAIRHNLEIIWNTTIQGDRDLRLVYQRALMSENLLERLAAVWGLSALQESFDELLPLINDPDKNVRQLAVIILAKMGQERALPVLRKILSDQVTELHLVVMIALKSIGPAGREDLKVHLVRKDALIRRAALEGIVEVCAPLQAIPFLRRALNDVNSTNRHDAAEHIERLVSSVEDQKQLRIVSRSLWWHLTDEEGVRQAAYCALSLVADRISELEVEQYVKSKIADPILGNQG